MTESPLKKKTGINRLIRAFFNSLAGLVEATTHESAFRLELFLAGIFLPTAILLPVTTIERVALIASALLVLIVELLNSSIEAAIDRISLDLHPLSKRAKDTASAAVLMSLVLFVVTWGLIVMPLVLSR